MCFQNSNPTFIASIEAFKDKDGETVMTRAVTDEDTQIVSTLIHHAGTLLNIPNESGKKPIDVANKALKENIKQSIPLELTPKEVMKSISLNNVEQI